MLNLGFTEILLAMVVAIVVVGPERLPTLLGWLGRQYGRLMSASEELRQAFVIEAERVEADKRAESLRKRREEARRRIEAARAQAIKDANMPVPRAPGRPRATVTATAEEPEPPNSADDAPAEDSSQ